MKVFILFAHPEPKKSFNAAMLEKAKQTLTKAGHEVKVSDLYAMNFNPVASADDFAERRFPDRLQYDREQKHVAQKDIIAEDIKAELDKICWCDVFIMHFPLYWFSMPAIMKGWIDRVFMNSIIYGKGKRYETGGLKGRRAMVVTSCGAFPNMFQSDGLLGDIQIALWHIHNGILHYVGFEVLEPFVSYSPVFLGQEACDQYFESYSQRLLNLQNETPLPFHYTHEFDENFKLKKEIEPRSVGHSRS